PPDASRGLVAAPPGRVARLALGAFLRVGLLADALAGAARVAGLEGAVFGRLVHVGHRVEQADQRAAEHGAPPRPRRARQHEVEHHEQRGELGDRAEEVPDLPGARGDVVQHPLAVLGREACSVGVREPAQRAGTARSHVYHPNCWCPKYRTLVGWPNRTVTAPTAPPRRAPRTAPTPTCCAWTARSASRSRWP